MTPSPWVAVVISALGLLVGTGWLQYFLTRRREKQERARTTIEGFLTPLRAVLDSNRRVFDELRADREMQSFEGHPGSLQKYFATLPGDDPRKYLWKSRIERLQNHNATAKNLIVQHRGRITTPEFKIACDEFIYHADKWEDVWKAIASDSPVPTELDRPGLLLAPRFPEGFDAAFAGEMRVAQLTAGD